MALFDFNTNANPQKPDFYYYLETKFGVPAANDILDVFAMADLPTPRSRMEFFCGSQGAIVPLDKYGILLRIEPKTIFSASRKDPRAPHKGGMAAMNNPWVSAPLVIMNTRGNAAVEFCPGWGFCGDYGEIAPLRGRLKKYGLNFFDDTITNVGHIPVRTPLFPNGATGVIDRPSFLTCDPSQEPPLTDRERQEEAELRAALDDRYGPLRNLLNKGLRGEEPMLLFWTLCEMYKEKGYLATGWTDPRAVEKRREVFRFEGYEESNQDFINTMDTKDAGQFYAPKVSKQHASSHVTIIRGVPYLHL